MATSPSSRRGARAITSGTCSSRSSPRCGSRARTSCSSMATRRRWKWGSTTSSVRRSPRDWSLRLPIREMHIHLPRLVAACVALALVPAIASAQFEAPAAPVAIHRIAGLDVGVHGDLNGFALGWTTRRIADDVEIATITLRRADPAPPPRFSLKWRIPSHDVMGNWASGRGLNKTMHPDWAGSRLHTSRFSQQAPVMTLFTNDGTNVLTFALSDALNTVVMGTGVREEDGWNYDEVSFFTEPHSRVSEYTAELRIDR